MTTKPDKFELTPLVQSVLDAEDALCCIVAASGEIVTVNDAWELSLPLEAQHRATCGVGANYFDVCRRSMLSGCADAQRILDACSQLLTSMRVGFQFDYECKRPNGSGDWFTAKVKPLSTTDGVFLLITHYCINQEVNLQNMLVAHEQWLDLALEMGQIGAWHWNLVTGRIRWNRQHAQILGLSLDEFDGSYEFFRRLVHPDELPVVEKAVDRARQCGTVFDADYRMKHVNGQWIVVHGVGQFVYDLLGNPVHMVGAFYDITMRRELSAALASRKQWEATSHLAAAIAHEFSNTLLAASASLYALEADEHVSTRCQRALSMIAEAQRLSETLLQVTSGESLDRAAECEPARIIASIISQTRPAIPAGVSLVAGDCLPGYWVRMDGSALEQTLRVLIGNAVTAVNGDGKIQISMEHPAIADGTTLSVHVVDDGPGVPQHLRENLFAPKPRRTDKSNQHGIGLAMAARLVYIVGGSIQYKAVEPHGADFVIKLPLVRGGMTS